MKRVLTGLCVVAAIVATSILADDPPVGKDPLPENFPRSAFIRVDLRLVFCLAQRVGLDLYLR
jgi:hypothetical protein